MLIIFDLDGTLFKAKLALEGLADAELTEDREALLKSVRERGELFPGVPDMLRELREDGYTLYVCSASGLDYIETALDATGIRPFFEMVYSAGGRDDKAEIFKTLAAPGKAVAVGDTWRDCKAARECGFYAVAAAYGYGNRALIEADAVAETVREIPRLVRELCVR